MKIRNKFALSNIVLVILPILISVIIGAMVFFHFGLDYWQPINQMYQGDNGIYSAQTLLYAYSDNIADYDWEYFESYKNISANDLKDSGDIIFLEKTIKMEEMEDELINLGFSFLVIEDENIIYSNINDEERLDLLLESTTENNNSLTSNTSEAFIKFSVPNSKIVVCAINSGDVIVNEDTYFEKYIIRFILLFFVIIIFVTVLISLIVSKINEKMILSPLKKLIYATEEISKGNLETKIEYNKKDEFRDLFISFDKMRQKLKESVEDEIKHDEYRKTLVADISHDLRTPLTTIKGYSEGLIDGIATTDEKKERYYKAIQVRTLDIERIINNLSILSNLELNKKEYNFAEMPVNDLIDNFILKRQDEYSDKGITFIYKKRCKSNVFVKIDSDQFQRVFLNLIENSYKYASKTSLIITFTAELKKDFVEIVVKDNGKGVSQNALRKLFDRFYQEDKVRSSSSDGNGLGLSIVKHIVTGHDGKIHAENSHGLAIHIDLPITNCNLRKEENL